MNYTIDEGGIHFAVNEHDFEERATDAIADATALEVVKREAAKIKQMYDEGDNERSATAPA